MKIFQYLVSFIIVSLLTSCGPSLKVISDFNGSMDYGNYKTFNYYEPDTVITDAEYPAVINQLNQRRIEKAIDEEMLLRGYIKSDNPDVLISYYLKVENKTEYTATSYNYGSPYYGGYGYYGYYGGYGHTSTSVSQYDYQVGTLIIDLVDREKNELIWYGAGTKALAKNPKNPEHVINYVITKIFEQYRFLAGQDDPVKSIPKK